MMMILNRIELIEIISKILIIFIKTNEINNQKIILNNNQND